MLTTLHIKNFALIDEADIELRDGLNILTGETGAGKSIILGAVNLALGARASKESIRTGVDFCLAELTFTGLTERIRKKAQELDISTDGDELVISRKLMANGKSVVRVNGELFSASSLRELTSELIDIHGQNDHQSLLNTARHLELLDRFAGDEVTGLRNECVDLYNRRAGVLREFDSLSGDDAALRREADLLAFEIDEIDRAELKEGEEEELKEEHKKLANAHVITENLAEVSKVLNDDGGVSDLLSDAVKALSRAAEFDPELSGYYDSLSDIDGCVSDVFRGISDYLSDMDSDDERREFVEDRLDLITGLKNKYGRTVKDIYAFRDEAAEKLEKLNGRDAYLKKLEKQLAEYESSLDRLYLKLTRLRTEAAKKLDGLITTALLDLNFNRVIFKTVVECVDGYEKNGPNTAVFMISLNPGEEPKPLNRIASGGEMSRIMLAIKAVMASKDEIPTLIFDEIDTGISGITAQRVSEKLAAIAGMHQVICITHLPQIASMADTHFCIRKLADESSTHVEITELGEEGAVSELSRLLGGETVTDSITESAQEMRKLAAKKKSELRK